MAVHSSHHPIHVVMIFLIAILTSFFTPVSGVAGLAHQATAHSKYLFGTTDSPNGVNIYRVLEISDKKMLIRAGDGTSTVWTMKFVAQ